MKTYRALGDLVRRIQGHLLAPQETSGAPAFTGNVPSDGLYTQEHVELILVTMFTKSLLATLRMRRDGRFDSQPAP